ncbi:MAG: T9SS type A sorting domain-containing protein [Candidatus Hatepunaea meridiana]|nr:T9SS type A sorting domain-containing protein [Candidatus Hatepunaea meridiana]
MKRIITLLLLCLAIHTVTTRSSFAVPPNYYVYLTNYEETVFEQIIWFWGDEYYNCDIFSNDYLGIESLDSSCTVYTAKERILYRNVHHEEPAFSIVFNCPEFYFPESYPHLIELANPVLDDSNGRLMTRVAMKGEDGIEIHQYPLGGGSPEPGAEDALVRRLDPPEWQIIYIDGQSEVYGILNGRFTIYSSGDMYLIDNILYQGADPQTGMFNEDDTQHLLGLVSDRNIIIRDNDRNGRSNGRNRYQPNEIEHHSIAINGSMMALDESFTFEHHNDDYEAYQGPTPDERGIIHIKGSLAQYRRGYVHRSNHHGTGYSKDYCYDSRLKSTGPPGFDQDYYPFISGIYDEINLSNGPYYFRNTIVNKLIIHPGVEITLHGLNALRVRDSLLALGTAEEPIIIRSEENESGHLWVERGVRSVALLQHTEVSALVTLRLNSDSINIEQSRINGCLYANGDIRLNQNKFTAPVDLTSFGHIFADKNVFKSGIKIRGNVRDGKFYNNTITGGNNCGVQIYNFRNLEIINCIIAFNRKGIYNQYNVEPVLRYNDVYANRDEDYFNCEPGVGSISADPLFVDLENGDFHLILRSPCINVGDPDFPRDPDGSIIEMGAFYFDPERSIDEDPAQVKDFGLTIAPNPFNRRTYLNIKTIIPSIAYIKVYNLSGRKVHEGIERVSTGMNRIKLDGKRLGGAGVYFMQVMTSGWTQTVKLVYLP